MRRVKLKLRCIESSYDPATGELTLVCNTSEHEQTRKTICFNKSDFHRNGGLVSAEDMQKLAHLCKGKRFSLVVDEKDQAGQDARHVGNQELPGS